MDLTQAIAGVESATAQLKTADDAQAVAQQKFEAARASKESADTANRDAVTAYNASLQELIAAAKASIRPTV